MNESSWLAIFKPLFEQQIPLHRELGLVLLEAREGVDQLDSQQLAQSQGHQGVRTEPRVLRLAAQLEGLPRHPRALLGLKPDEVGLGKDCARGAPQSGLLLGRLL